MASRPLNTLSIEELEAVPRDDLVVIGHVFVALAASIMTSAAWAIVLWLT